MIATLVNSAYRGETSRVGWTTEADILDGVRVSTADIAEIIKHWNKLREMDDKHHFLKRGAKVVDLGAAPGGWTQILVERCGTSNVLGVDLQVVDPIDGAELLELDFMLDDAPRLIKEKLNGAVDAVLSDMASPATGHRETDHIRVMGLCEAALEFSLEVLKPGGTFICKVLRGGTERALLEVLKKRFGKVFHMKPPASRADSAEMYVIAMNFRGTLKSCEPPR